MLAFAGIDGNMSWAKGPPSRIGSPQHLDNSTPVTDPKAYSSEYVERLSMLGTDYCVPRIASLEIHRPADGGHTRGANAALDAVTLTNSSPPPWRKGEPNREWSSRVIIGITPSRPDWGFPGVFKLRTGKESAGIVDRDLSTIEDIRSAIQSERQGLRPAPERQFLLRVDGEVALVVWRPTGALQALYGIGPGVAGSLTVRDEYLDRLTRLIEVASKFVRRCDALP